MIIGICGGSGSGKTTTARKVLEKIGKNKVVLLEQDSYYYDLAHLSFVERKQTNFDHPDAIDFDTLAENLRSLSNNEEVEIPIYDFSSHTTIEKKNLVKPKPVVIIEGILIFANQKIIDLLDLRVFIDTPDDLRLIRRIRRDVKERGRTIEQTLNQYEKTIRPMHKKFVEPNKQFADIVVTDIRQQDVITNILCSLINQEIAKAVN